MESDIKLTIKGLDSELAHEFGKYINILLSLLNKPERGFDLRRMHRIIVTSDFASELVNFSNERGIGKPITHTNEKYGVAAAQVHILARGDDYEIVPIIDACLATALVDKDYANPIDLSQADAIHILHHEFCHVHDNNKKIDAFGPMLLNQSYVGKDKYCFPLSELCWSEYYANYLSCSSVSDEFLGKIKVSFIESIERAKSEINKEIVSYRMHGDIDQLLDIFARHGSFLPKIASYILGYLDGLQISFEELDSKAAKVLSGSYFEPTWTAMQKALRSMRDKYPDRWKSIAIYKGLSDVMDNYYSVMGLTLNNMEDGIVYVDVPLKPETTPTNPFLSQGLDWFTNVQ